MGDLFNVLWAILSTMFSVVWSVVWFVVSDLISTLLWIGILVWLVMSARYRSFYGGALAMLRYARQGIRLLWGWIRKRPVTEQMAAARPVAIRVDRHRMPLVGYVSLSGQMTALLITMIMLRMLLPD